MKRQIYTSDWAYDDNQMVNAFKEVMAANMDHQDDGEVGIFWYDPNKQELFGIKSADVNDVPFTPSTMFSGKEVKTCRPLHYKVWEKEQYRKKDRRFRGDYTATPRGRVFFVKDQGFIVVTGDWINKYPEAKDEILDEFNLPEDTEFMIDSHWNVGHGKSDKFDFGM